MITITPLIITASSTEPTSAEMPAPAASAGVSGFASSSTVVCASERGSSPSVVPVSRLRRTASASGIPSDDEPSRERTSLTDIACQGVVSARSGVGTRAADRPDHSPRMTATSETKAFTKYARRSEVTSGPAIASRLPTTAPVAPRCTPLRLTPTARGRQVRNRWTPEGSAAMSASHGRSACPRSATPTPMSAWASASRASRDTTTTP